MKAIINLFLFIFLFMNLSFSSFAAIATPDKIATEKAKEESVFKQLSMEEIFIMPRKDMETQIGRKLKFKEKLGLLIVQKAVKKAAKKRTQTSRNKNLLGILSTVFGGLSIVSIIEPLGTLLFGIAGITLGIIGLKRKEPKKILSVLGIVFSSLSILFLLGLFIALIIILSS